MNQQERQVISDIFDRLRQAADQPRDPEAERFIAEKLREQPYAPYAMAQSIFVQEQALANLNQQVEQLRAEVEEQRQQPQGGGGFLSSIFGGGGAREPERSGRMGGGPQGQGGPWGARRDMDGPGMGQQGGPWGGQQAGMQPGMMGQQPGMFGQRGGSGFLGTALTTAAGVAGGMMLGNVLTNAFKGGEGAGAAGAGAGGADQASFLSGGEGAAGAGSAPQAGITDGMYQDAGLDQGGVDPGGGYDADFGGDAGGDFGGGDDFA